MKRKIKEFKSRIRIKGKIVAKSLTKKGNLKITVKKEEEEIGSNHFMIFPYLKSFYATTPSNTITATVLKIIVIISAMPTYNNVE